MHLVLFDIDGTLVRGKGVGTTALKSAFAEVFDRDAETVAVASVFIAGSTDPVILDDMRRAMEIPREEFERYEPVLRETYFRHLTRTVRESTTLHVLPGVVALLERLHAHDRVTSALLTGNLERSARIKLSPFEINHFFDFGGFGGDGEDRAAQAMHARREAESRTGVSYAPDQVLVVGDTVNDIRAGQRHEFLTVGVGTGWGSLEELRQEGATEVFESLAPEHGFPDWLDARWSLGW